MKAERYHITEGKEHVPGYHPDDLYKMIGSTYEIAYLASERLAQS